MEKLFSYRYFFFMTLLTISIPCLAAGAEIVKDPWSLAQLNQQLEQMQSSYNELENTYHQLKDQYQELQDMHNDIHDDLHGNFQVGTLYNDLNNAVDSWQWTAETWDKELKTLSGGNSERYNELTKQYQTYYPQIVPASTYQQGSTPQATQEYTQAVNVNQTASAEASYQFSDIDTRLKEVQDLSQKIDTTTTEKEALDLNSKLSAQIAYINIEMLRMQTLVNEQVAQGQAKGLEEEADATQFNNVTTP